MFFEGHTKHAFRNFRKKNISVNNFVSKLHHRYTFLFFLGLTGTMQCITYFLEHIQCVGLTTKAQSTLCYITGIYTVKRSEQLSNHSDDTLMNLGITTPGQNDRIYHTIYPWMNTILLIQCILFLLPQFIWKKYYGYYIFSIVLPYRNVLSAMSPIEYSFLKLQSGIKMFACESTANLIFSIAHTLNFYERRKTLSCWSYFLLLKELANLLNVTTQFCILTKLLGGDVFKILSYSVSSNHNNYVNPFDVSFPKLAKCDFLKFGPSGGLTTQDLMCVLPHNMFYEKCYFVMWFWFCTLTILSFFAVFWRIFSWMCYRNRMFNEWILRWWYNIKKEDPVYKMLHPNYTKSFYNQSSYSDWLLLNTVGQNIDNCLFRGILQVLTNIEDNNAAGPPKMPINPKEFKQFVCCKLDNGLGTLDVVDKTL